MDCIAGTAHNHQKRERPARKRKKKRNRKETSKNQIQFTRERQLHRELRQQSSSMGKTISLRFARGPLIYSHPWHLHDNAARPNLQVSALDSAPKARAGDHINMHTYTHAVKPPPSCPLSFNMTHRYPSGQRISSPAPIRVRKRHALGSKSRGVASDAHR